MTVKIDGVEPNIFPHVDDLDARDAGRNVEVFLDVRIEGNHTPVTVKLSYEQASDLAILLEPFRKPQATSGALSASGLGSARRGRVAFLKRKYFSTNFPSRPASGSPQARQLISRLSVSGPASALTT